MKRLTVIGLGGAAVVVGAAGWLALRPHDRLKQASHLIAAGNLRAAQLVLRGEVLDHPGNNRAHYMLAGVELQTGDPVGAEREAQAAAQGGYDPAATELLLAAAALQQNHFDVVLSSFQPRPGMTPAQTASIMIDRASAQMSLGRLDESRASLAAARAGDPNSFEVAMAEAKFALIQKDSAGAGQQLDRALRIQPGAPDALLMRGDLQQSTGQQAAALASYSAAVARQDAARLNDRRGRLARADLLSTMGRAAEARADIAVLLKANPTDPAANLLLGRLLVEAQDWHGADAALKNAASLIDRIPRAGLYVAIVAANLQQPQQALDAAEGYFAKTQQTDPDAARLIAQINMRMGNPSRAIAVLQPFVQSGHADPAILQLLASAQQQGGNAPAALQTLLQARQASPDDPHVLDQLAALRLQQGNAGAAVTDLQQALDLSQGAKPGPIIDASLYKTENGQPPPNDAVQTAFALIEASLRNGDIQRASDTLDRVRRMPGVTPFQIDMLAGVIHIAKVDLAGARASFEAAVKEKPDDSNARSQLARVMVLQGQTGPAIQMLSTLADKDPANVAVLGALVGALLTENKPDQAVQRLEAAHTAAPTSAGITLSLAQLYVRAGNPSKALALVSADTTANPQMLDMQARLQLAAGQSKAAADSLRKLLVQQPGNPLVTLQLAQALLAAGDADGARVAVQDGINANPGNVALLNMAVGIAARAGTPSGLAMADQLAQDKANLPAALPLKGDLLMAQHQYPAAQEAFEAANRSAPSGLLTARIAAALQAQGKQEAAAALLRARYADHPEDADIAMVLASQDIASKQLARAADELAQVIKQHPDNAAALNNLAWIEQQNGDLRGARQSAQRAYGLQASAQTADTLGWIMVQQGDSANALPLLQQAAAASKDDPSVQYHLAAALEKAGQPANAAAILKPLLARPAPFDDRVRATQLLAGIGH